MTPIVRWLIRDILRPLQGHEDGIHKDRTGILASCRAEDPRSPSEPWAVAREVRPVCKLDRTYISDVDRGVRNISLLNLWKIAKALKVPINTLL